MFNTKEPLLKENTNYAPNMGIDFLHTAIEVDESINIQIRIWDLPFWNQWHLEMESILRSKRDVCFIMNSNEI